MKTILRPLILGWFLVYLPLANAENMSSLSNVHMQNMVVKMNEMQQCLQQLDEIKLQENQEQMTQQENELRALCSAGKRDDAQEKALEFTREMQNSDTFHKIQACTQDMQQQGFMPSFPVLATDAQGNSTTHICDQLK